MKIIYKAWAGGGDKELSVEEAIERSLMPFAYSYDGQLEKLQSENEKLREMLTKLVTHLSERDVTLLPKILNPGMEISE